VNQSADNASLPKQPGEVAEWILKARFAEVTVNFRTIWDLYLKFYALFLPFNIAALTWVFGRSFLVPTRSALALSFILQNVNLAVTSALMANHSRLTDTRVRTLLDRIVDLACARGEAIQRSAIVDVDIPTKMARWAGWANFWGMFFLIAIWVFYWVVGGVDPPTAKS
jgi:hypothetical protein